MICVVVQGGDWGQAASLHPQFAQCNVLKDQTSDWTHRCFEIRSKTLQSMS